MTQMVRLQVSVRVSLRCLSILSIREYAEEEASEGESEVAALESSNSKRTGLANAMAKILSQEVGERKVCAHSALPHYAHML